jgi:hypothetical protein
VDCTKQRLLTSKPRNRYFVKQGSVEARKLGQTDNMLETFHVDPLRHHGEPMKAFGKDGSVRHDAIDPVFGLQAILTGAEFTRCLEDCHEIGVYATLHDHCECLVIERTVDTANSPAAVIAAGMIAPFPRPRALLTGVSQNFRAGPIGMLPILAYWKGVLGAAGTADSLRYDGHRSS